MFCTPVPSQTKSQIESIYEVMDNLCTAIVFKERIDAYAWMIRQTVQMTSGFQMSEMRDIFGDGILGGEKLLQQLDIQDTCYLVLDHQHLLSSDFGAWPKRFGGPIWATELKHYCHELVKTYDMDTYKICLERIREVVKHNHEWSDYVERNIQIKRHLFTNHLIQHYPLNSITLNGIYK
jgi:hypothetical protein